jgi:hypothetical protein
MEFDNENKTKCNDGNIFICLIACDIYSLCVFFYMEFLASILNVMKLLSEIRRVKCRSVQEKLNLLIQFVEENTEIEEYVN